jgi:hypothetical protein
VERKPIVREEQGGSKELQSSATSQGQGCNGSPTSSVEDESHLDGVSDTFVPTKVTNEAWIAKG